MAMAPFSFQNYNPFLLESSSRLFLHTITNNNNNNNNNKMCSSILEEPNSFTPWFPHQFYRPETPLQELSSVNFSSSTKVSLTSGNNSSSLLPGDQLTQKITPMSHKKRKKIINSAQSKDTREAVLEGKKQRKSYNNEKKKSGGSNNNKKKRKAQSEEEAPTGYIHVRARRGQATDSHSLAERARRQKISEKMKLLQALVPGCDNVTGKALLLDEIINYVQSLQNQVEFLSMELASVNSFFNDFGVDMEAFIIKPERIIKSEAPRQPDAQHCSPNQSAINTFTFTTANNYSLMDPANLLLLQQGQMPTILSQDNEQLLWDADHEQRQQNISQAGFSNNSCSFL